MSTNIVHDIYDGKKVYLIAGSTEKLILHIKNAKRDEPYSLKRVDRIIWRISPFSVLANKNYAVIEKRMKSEYTPPLDEISCHIVEHEMWINDISESVGKCTIKYTYTESEEDNPSGNNDLKYEIISKEETGINDIVITDIENGTIELIIRGSDTIDLQGGFKHQVILEADAGKRFIPFNGVLMIDRCVSEYKPPNERV